MCVCVCVCVCVCKTLSESDIFLTAANKKSSLTCRDGDIRRCSDVIYHSIYPILR